VDVTVTVKANICFIAIGHRDHEGMKQAYDTAFGSAVAVFLQLPAGSRAWSSLLAGLASAATHGPQCLTMAGQQLLAMKPLQLRLIAFNELRQSDHD
jgi:hypothetical protein